MYLKELLASCSAAADAGGKKFPVAPRCAVVGWDWGAGQGDWEHWDKIPVFSHQWTHLRIF